MDRVAMDREAPDRPAPSRAAPGRALMDRVAMARAAMDRAAPSRPAAAPAPVPVQAHRVLAVRIVGGRHRGRRLEAPPSAGVRPTSDRVREAVFNLLLHAGFAARVDGAPVLDGARVLDAFCGTGALGLEALSRGAASVAFLDNAPSSLAVVRRNLALLGEAEAATVVRADCARPPLAPPVAQSAADLVFLDPPYRQGLVAPALSALAERGWIAPGALCVVEEAADTPPDLPDGWAILDMRTYGETTVTFARAPG
jgi:16S rRNA (guanine966-N2)-methyltransferase